MMAYKDSRLKLDDHLSQNLLFASLDDEVSYEWNLNVLYQIEESRDGESYPVSSSDNNINSNNYHAV